MEIDLLTRYRTTTCCIKDCLVSFAMTDEFYNKRLVDKQYFYCPNGHKQYFISETEEAKLKEKVEQLNRKIEFLRDCKRRVEYSRRHWKGEVTKLAKKILKKKGY